MWTRMRAAALIVAALTLASCGSIHPGDAAVVDGHSISMAKFDKTARVYCQLTLLSAKEQGVMSVPNSDVRRQTISDLVTIYVARDLAKEEGVTVDKKLYELRPTRSRRSAQRSPRATTPSMSSSRSRTPRRYQRSRSLSRRSRRVCRPPRELGSACRRGQGSDHRGVQGPRREVRSSIRFEQQLEGNRSHRILVRPCNGRSR